MPPMEPLVARVRRRGVRAAAPVSRTAADTRDLLDPRTSVEDLGGQLMQEEAGVESVAWEHTRRERT
jgi:hypothetical protein